MKRSEECGAYERQFADVGGKGPRRLFDEMKYFSREHKTWSKYLEYAVSSVADSGFNSEDNENKWKWGKTWDK